MLILDAAQATTEDRDHASGFIGACHLTPVDMDYALTVPCFPVALVAHWSSSPADRDAPDEDNLWCNPTCTPDAHDCPDGPRLAPEPDPDDECAARDCGDGEVIAHYAAHIPPDGPVEGWPPLVIIDNRRDCPDDAPLDRQWLVEDGYHRISACLLVGRESFPAIVLPAVAAG